MNKSLSDIQKEYFPYSQVIEITDKEQIQRLLESKMSCTWGSGQKLEGGWVFLYQPSPSQANNPIIVYVCREENIINSTEVKLVSIADALQAKLKQAENLSRKLKNNLKTANSSENFGQNELRKLQEFIGSDLYLRVGNKQVFISVINDFDRFVDCLVF